MVSNEQPESIICHTCGWVGLFGQWHSCAPRRGLPEHLDGLRADIERLTNERDRAREECGHEKAMRASQREEMMRYFVDWQAAKATVARVEALCDQADMLFDEPRIPTHEIRIALLDAE